MVTYGERSDGRGFALTSRHEIPRIMIKEGDPAPDFDLETDEGTRVSLSSLKGRNVVLFFYPKDNTSG
jgi:cytochrome oxidase Cu insertion factor (SCO1/SenC/PrrC family)